MAVIRAKRLFTVQLAPSVYTGEEQQSGPVPPPETARAEERGAGELYTPPAGYRAILRHVSITIESMPGYPPGVPNYPATSIWWYSGGTDFRVWHHWWTFHQEVINGISVSFIQAAIDWTPMLVMHPGGYLWASDTSTSPVSFVGSGHELVELT